MLTSSTNSTKLQHTCASALRAVGGFNLAYKGEDKQQLLASNTKMLGTVKNQLAEFTQQQKTT